jgi:hypothetical protein
MGLPRLQRLADFAKADAALPKFLSQAMQPQIEAADAGLLQSSSRPSQDEPQELE